MPSDRDKVLVGDSVWERATLVERDGWLHVEFDAEDLDSIAIPPAALSAAVTARPDWEAIVREAKPLVSVAPFSSGVMRARRDKWLRAFEASLGEGSEEAESQ